MQSLALMSSLEDCFSLASVVTERISSVRVVTEKILIG